MKKSKKDKRIEELERAFCDIYYSLNDFNSHVEKSLMVVFYGMERKRCKELFKLYKRIAKKYGID